MMDCYIHGYANNLNCGTRSSFEETREEGVGAATALPEVCAQWAWIAISLA